MSLEIELKYRIKEPSEDFILKLLTDNNLSNFKFGDITKKEIVDIYYDTHDYRISKSKSILRVRVENYRTFLLSIKTTVNVNDAKFEREEIEETISEDFAEKIHKKLIDFGLELKEFDKFDYFSYGVWGLFKIWNLKEIFVCENFRTIRDLYNSKDEHVAELSIDEVLISTFGKKEKFKELEIESKNNSDEIEIISKYIDENFNNQLGKGDKSKFETGIKLLFGDKLDKLYSKD